MTVGQSSFGKSAFPVVDRCDPSRVNVGAVVITAHRTTLPGKPRHFVLPVTDLEGRRRSRGVSTTISTRTCSGSEGVGVRRPLDQVATAPTAVPPPSQTGRERRTLR